MFINVWVFYSRKKWTFLFLEDLPIIEKKQNVVFLCLLSTFFTWQEYQKNIIYFWVSFTQNVKLMSSRNTKTIKSAKQNAWVHSIVHSLQLYTHQIYQWADDLSQINIKKQFIFFLREKIQNKLKHFHKDYIIVFHDIADVLPQLYFGKRDYSCCV